jgi:3-oxoacyl-[acyl-carrier-protein] synthase II
LTTAVAVTGVGAVTPLGIGAGRIVDRLTAGESGPTNEFGRYVDFAPQGFLTRREIKRNARFAQFALVAAIEAAAQAGWAEGLPYSPDDVICVIGTGLGGAPEVSRNSGPGPLSVPLMMSNSAAASVCMRLGLHGESMAVGGACAAGAQAIGLALGAIRRGEVTAAVVGGSEAALVPLVHESFRQAGALSPTGRCLPFDVNREGFVMGEGAGMLILENLDRARARGAEILGLVIGYGASSDAHHLTAPPPGGRPASLAVRRALTDADTSAADVSYINAHGTGTQLNDATEIHALRAVFGNHLVKIPLSSTKASTGHLFGAGGAVEAIVTLAALDRGIAPPTLGLTEPDPALGEVDHLRSPGEVTARAHGRIGLSNSFGFGGHNSVLVLAEAG